MTRGRSKYRIPAPTLPHKGAIPSVPAKEPNARISFERVEAGAEYCLSWCARDQVKEAVDALRQVSSLPWRAIYSLAGLRLKSLPDSALLGVKRPSWLSQDIGIIEIRASQRFRILGYREANDLVVLWFDPDHEATGR